MARVSPVLIAGLFFVFTASSQSAPKPDSAEFFEAKIRPVLVEQCYKCHSAKSKEPKGGLRVDGRAALIQGGDGGTALVPGQPDKSKLIEAIRYTNTDLLMPPKAKLPAGVIADFEAWVKAGAPWPDDAGVTAPGNKSAFDLAARKASHWAWASIKRSPVPTVQNPTWVRDPVDAFILSKLEAKGITPAPPADKAAWLRRVTYALIGLPPTPAELDTYLADHSPEADAKVVDRLLSSPQFGVRWGRHWLDLVRYAESRGHEFEPEIPNAYQYRDAIVRALNADVPYQRLVMEHLAGDLIPDPRIDPTTGTNESVALSGFWHLGEEVHSPVDLRLDQSDRLDNRIDVMTKTFLGLTVSCARCHDHKFDAISTKDYYALYGLLEGSGYRQVRIDGWAKNRQVANELSDLRLADDRALSKKLDDAKAAVEAPAPDAAYESWLKTAKIVVDYANPRPDDWLPDDVTFGSGPRPAGFTSIRPGMAPTVQVEERTAAVFDPFWAGLKLSPGTAHDFGPLGRQARAGFTIRTPNFVLEKPNLYYLVRGGGTSYAAVNGHTIISGPLHGRLVQGIPNAATYRWVGHGLGAEYVGQRLHVELSADPKSDFAVAMVVQSDRPPPSVLKPSPAITKKIEKARTADLKENISATEAGLKSLAGKVTWDSRLALSLHDANRVAEAVFIRGNPKTPGEPVNPRFLEAFVGSEGSADGPGSGRLEVAKQIADPTKTPLVSRVAVNRVWHHLFGRGIVASTDNFGVLGELPSHPELLDTLADDFVREGWSLKRLIRRLVLSRTYRMASQGAPAGDTADPGNILLHEFRIKRLEGEAIRDSILAVSGRLDPTLGGPPVPIFLTPFLDGRGRPASGPLDGNGRRSIYLSVRRNFLNPFLQAFDTPIPFSTVGRRQVSNVPALALILLNDPFVHAQAEVWARRVLKTPGSADERITQMYRTALTRPPTTDELASCRAFVGDRTDERTWADLAHTLFNMKEFVFVP